MPAATKEVSGEHVTRAEFRAFSENINSAFESLDRNLREHNRKTDQSISELHQRHDQSRQTNWGVIAAWSTVVVAILGSVVGLAGTLAYNQFGASEKLSVLRDEALLAQIEGLRSGNNRWTRGDQDRFADQLAAHQLRQDNDIEDHTEDLARLQTSVEVYRDELARRGNWIDEASEKIDRLDELVRSKRE